MENAHKEFQKAIGAAVCRYVPERGVLLAISRHENLHRHSSMLQEMHFRNLSQKDKNILKHVKHIFASCILQVLLLKRTEEAARQLESTKLQTIGGKIRVGVAIKKNLVTFKYLPLSIHCPGYHPVCGLHLLAEKIHKISNH
ncbi:LOW QUALITY PROTEIN: hypothetical protein E2986_10577 [Frieseomelitta varia]|uniref:Synaptic functional regulator FMRP KH0 domain-containing protein n=1 Tax=Frieseomelitta varia TaxID=561572 RepID=A0A833VPA5_9HYME|nr:LOW QUALITY PROTEIN: hypothetical protein E2986_10577 [Frieseomelitta varia]